MTTTTHTPGPWAIGARHDEQTQRVVAPTPGGRGHWTIALVGDIDRNANAHLIAAAPDILAALRDLLTIGKWKGRGTHGTAGLAFEIDREIAHVLVENARDAIAKAEGSADD